MQQRCSGCNQALFTRDFGETYTEDERGMLRLTGAFRYFFCSENVSFRCKHNGLASYIKCSLQRDPSNGDVYIFMSKDQRKLRVFYYHHCGFILTEKVLSEGKFLRPVYDEVSKCYRMAWSDFVRMLEGIVPGRVYFKPETCSQYVSGKGF